MGASTEIAWTDSTFNAWHGCTAISPACTNCYAESMARRFGTEWGEGRPRRTFGDRHWQMPVNWDKAHADFFRRHGRRRRVFSASMSDVFDKDAPSGERERLWSLVRATPNLTWQILTKRIGNVPRMLPPDWGDGYANVHLGITLANQPELERDLGKLLRVSARVRFVSAEPLLGPLDFTRARLAGQTINALQTEGNRPGIDWIIVGGESGTGARPMDIEWARDIARQSRRHGVPFFMKQLGGTPNKRAALEEFPEDLRIREFPGIQEGGPVPAA